MSTVDSDYYEKNVPKTGYVQTILNEECDVHGEQNDQASPGDPSCWSKAN